MPWSLPFLFYYYSVGIRVFSPNTLEGSKSCSKSFVNYLILLENDWLKKKSQTLNFETTLVVYSSCKKGSKTKSI